MAQNITFEEAKETAHKLYEIELLSEKGKKQLFQEIEKNRLENKSDSVEKSFVLRFLYRAFDMELYYRTGMFTKEQYFFYQGEADKISKNKELSEDEKDEAKKKIEEYYVNIERREIEKAIEDEEEEIKEYDSSGGYVIYPPLYVDEKNTNIIHKNRSTVGKTTTRTLNDLFKIGLIDKIIFENLSQQIKKKYIREGEIIRLILEKI
jgi:hypothetical protein